jgi:hypothetical protein
VGSAPRLLGQVARPFVDDEERGRDVVAGEIVGEAKRVGIGAVVPSEGEDVIGE